MKFDVIIIGGSYAGLSAALALGRAKRKVLIIDAGKPCNRQTPHAHNFLTHDGAKPADISAKGKADALAYPSVKLMDGKVTAAIKKDEGFEVSVEDNSSYFARKLLIATGLKDVFPQVKGFAECWGISVIHCPYCHGYEVKDENIGLMMNGDIAFEMAKNINHWNSDLTLLTNGKSQLTPEQTAKLISKSIAIIEDEIFELVHEHGELKHVVFKNGKELSLKAIYAKSEVEQYVNFDQQLGFELTEFNTIKVDAQQQTTAKGVYAAGDSTNLMRSLSNVTAAGTLAAVMINKEMISEDF